MQTMAVDFGAGNLKVYGQQGGVLMPSQVALPVGKRSGEVIGLRSAEHAQSVEVGGRELYVGKNAHRWGRPVENLDNARFVSGAPDVRALLYAAMALYREDCGEIPAELELVVGLPQSALSEDVQEETVAGLKRWMRAEHTWAVDGAGYRMNVERVRITTQAAGALFDYLLDDSGEFIAARKPNFKKEVGIISVGMNTLELLVVEGGSPVERFVDSETAGVRRLLELADPQGLYSRGELDEKLRGGELDVDGALPVWGSEVVGHIERRWGRAYQRFAAIVVVGGGAILLRDLILAKFNGRSVVPKDPVMAVARGLWKLRAMQHRRYSHKRS
jgi:hypothetical protein